MLTIKQLRAFTSSRFLGLVRRADAAVVGRLMRRYRPRRRRGLQVFAPGRRRGRRPRARVSPLPPEACAPLPLVGRALLGLRAAGARSCRSFLAPRAVLPCPQPCAAGSLRAGCGCSASVGSGKALTLPPASPSVAPLSLPPLFAAPLGNSRRQYSLGRLKVRPWRRRAVLLLRRRAVRRRLPLAVAAQRSLRLCAARLAARRA